MACQDRVGLFIGGKGKVGISCVLHHHHHHHLYVVILFFISVWVICFGRLVVIGRDAGRCTDLVGVMYRYRCSKFDDCI